MEFLEEVKSLGFNIDDAIERFMGNSALLEKMIKMLPSSVYPSRFGGNKEDDMEVLAYIESGNLKTAVEKAHTLKGMMGNLSLNRLYIPYTKLVDLLRAGDTQNSLALIKKIVPVQEEIISKIIELSK